MKYSSLLIIVILVIAGTTVTSVVLYEYQNEPEPVIKPIVKLPVEPIVEDDVQIIEDDIPLIEDVPIQNNTGYKSSLSLTNDDYEVMVQKHYGFANQFQSLVLIHGNVLSNPIDYGYVYEEGFTDKDLGIEYCTTLNTHIINIASLHRGLNYSLGQLVLIEDKSSDTIVLIEEKYKVLCGEMFKETSLLKYNFHTFECGIILDGELDTGVIPQ